MPWKELWLLALALWLSLGCTPAGSVGTRDVRIGAWSGENDGHAVNQVEMQQAVERFTGEFVESLIEALEPLARSEDPRIRREALRRVLLYASSALDIASGPLPEVNALDLLVFVRLSRRALERHWVPEVFGQDARPLVSAFAAYEERAWRLVQRVLDREQRQQLSDLVDAWEDANPDQVRVEAVRFEEFAQRSGRVADDFERNAAGILGAVKRATGAADRALLLGERAMFLSHRLPFLMRLQARIGAQEVVADSLAELRAPEMLAEFAGLSEDARATAYETRALLEELGPILHALPPQEEIQGTLDRSNALADRGLALLRETRALLPEDQSLRGLEAGGERLMRRFFLYAALFAGAFSLLFWGGYYAARRLSE